MNCIEFETALERAVEQRLPVDPAILDHASDCSECQQALERHWALEAAIGAWRSPELPNQFVDLVLNALSQPESIDESIRPTDPTPVRLTRPQPVSRGIGSSRSHGIAVVAMVTCLVLMVGFLAQVTQQDPASLASRSAGRWNQSDQTNEPLDFSGTLTAVLSDLKTEYSEIAVETTTAAREMVSAIPRPDASTVLPESDEFTLQSSGEVTRILRPIGDQVSSALGFLWQAVPSEIPSG